MPDTRPLVVAVVGPTASGKSDLALDLAEALGGEVVNADASQLYRGMDIGTAKVPPAQRRGIPHHQLDVLDVTDEASVAAYQQHARADLAAIAARGRHAVVVGGSGLYVRALLDRLEIPPTDPEVRARLEEEAARLGTATLYARLRGVDPTAADAIEPNNTRRVVRALEVIDLTGRPFSATLPAREYLRPTLALGLELPREVLDERIGCRVARMWRDGLLDEVRALEPLGLRDGRTASRALGYAQALAQLDGAMTETEAQDQTAAMTRRFARRQESWFRPDPRVTWLDPQEDGASARALALVRAAIGDNGRHG
jgi:tRNA dimethylallyltransferase